MRLVAGSSKPWLYAVRLIPVPGVSYVGSTAIIMCYGTPTPHRPYDFFGRRLSSAYAVDKNGVMYSCYGVYGQRMTYEETTQYLALRLTMGVSYMMEPGDRVYFGERWEIRQVASPAFRRWYETACESA